MQQDPIIIMTLSQNIFYCEGFLIDLQKSILMLDKIKVMALTVGPSHPWSERFVTGK